MPNDNQPVNVAIVGTGDGQVKTQLLVTPDNQPNVVVSVVTPIAAIVIRFVNSYLTVLVGLITAGLTSNIIPASDFYHLFLKCAALSTAGPCVGLIKDVITIFGRLETKYPLFTGNV